MNSNLINAIILSGAFLALFAIGELMYHKFNVKAELTRKWSHIGTGLLTMLFPVMLTSHWWVLMLCSSFLILLISSRKFGFLKSINAVDRETLGSLLYPVAVYFCFIIYEWKDDLAYFYLPILTLALCDPLAALVGKRWPMGKFHIGRNHKTLAGCFAFLIGSILLTLAIYSKTIQTETFNAFSIALVVAIPATIAEALSTKGYDNLTIPLSVTASLLIIHQILIL